MPAWVRQNSVTRDGSIAIRTSGGIPVVDETYGYIVETDSPFTPYGEIIDADGMPLVGTTVSPSGIGICVNKQAKQDKSNAKLWRATADFSTEVEENQAGGNDPTNSPNPEIWVPIYETKFERMSETFTKDKAGTAVANSAGQPFESGIILTRFIPIWEFFQIESGTISDETIIERNETTNSQTFKGRPEDTLLLTVMSSVIGYYYGARRRLTKYAIRYNKDKWKYKKLDTGTAYLSGGTLEPYWADTTKKNHVIHGGLDGSGGRVASGADPAVLEFEKYDQLNFSTFLRI